MEEIIEYILIALVYIVVIGAFAFSATKVGKQKDDKNSSTDSDDECRNHKT